MLLAQLRSYDIYHKVAAEVRIEYDTLNVFMYQHMTASVSLSLQLSWCYW